MLGKATYNSLVHNESRFFMPNKTKKPVIKDLPANKYFAGFLLLIGIIILAISFMSIN